MTEREKVEREIASTKARIFRSWGELSCPDLSLEKRVAKVETIEGDNRFLALLLARLKELCRTA